ncbi:hypothetical protein F906_01707 [Acinetobacter pseudolwoffii]|uniref:Uncharacterized protein n=1 Tax=Acinetobacter pseudolwoffii TaxID=2053287 RepID=N9KRP5_9GAMM|nr:Rha family transcriptional regulator [Acinetobacter pseudolwoffii]ENW86648.1 hypothetical protein F906_01707 [Acinetobacter pseudolwoffii]
MSKPLNFSTEAQNQLIEISNRFHNSDNQAEATTTSLKVAKYFQRNHRDVLRAIKNCGCSDEFRQRNFAQSSYLNEQGKSQPMYEMTKNGFSFIAMGFTGKQAAQFKESYINAFDEMSSFINSQNLTLISQFNKAVLQYERASDAASDAGRNLVLFGRKIKPLAAEKVAELERQLQPLLFDEEGQ